LTYASVIGVTLALVVTHADAVAVAIIECRAVRIHAAVITNEARSTLANVKVNTFAMHRRCAVRDVVASCELLTQWRLPAGFTDTESTYTCTVSRAVVAT
jgi:hypothetical protein